MEEKISYVRLFAGWDWVIGTGVYFCDVRDATLETILKFVPMMILAVVISLAFIMLLTRNLKQTLGVFLGLIKKFMRSARAGELKSRIDTSQIHPEFRPIGTSFNEIVELMQAPVVEAVDVLRDRSNDCFNKKMQGDYSGDHAILKNAINDAISSSNERMMLEKERQKMHAQMVHSDRLASIGTLAAGVAHEINNPLTIITVSIDLTLQACHDLDQQRIQSSLTNISEATERIVKIVNGLRTYARPDTDHIEVINAHECIQQTLALVQEIYKKQNITITTEFEAKQPLLKANIGKLQQIFMNLISNAKDAVEDVAHGSIKIKTQNVSDSVLIEISDNGKGIKEEILAKIFDPFFTTKAPGKGTGLGLSITHMLVNSFHGKISVESEIGLGTCFQIQIPSVNEKEVVAPKANQKSENLTFSGVALVVDDEKLIREIVCGELTKLGLAVFWAEDGEAAYEMIKKQTFDYIITDIKMPKMRGDQLMKRVKEENLASNSKFIVMTGGVVTEFSSEERVFLRKNADAYVKKPFKTIDIYNALKSVESKG
ncbi:MAG: response regulator [Oligoflexia bacterium]|nr:response regulator [Oligoflexia bacterium]